MTSFALKLQVLLLPLSSKALRLQPLPHRLALASVDTLFAYSIAQALHLNYAPDTIWNFILFCSLSKTICSLLKYVPHETRNLLNTGGHDWNRTSGCDEVGRFCRPIYGVGSWNCTNTVIVNQGRDLQSRVTN